MPVIKARKLEEAGKTVEKAHMISLYKFYSTVHSMPGKSSSS